MASPPGSKQNGTPSKQPNLTPILRFGFRYDMVAARPATGGWRCTRCESGATRRVDSIKRPYPPREETDDRARPM